ncbi:hypothetical protein SAMN02745194_02283 [Roseomonas rosea]|uniref:Uncharacterized protein n=1 Tax=Muricoccus roseus TaxID=198092 RepID=A0A1M6I9Z8_9PROT|nr:hypothetical protein [Roseomonas rosea]SHJ31271.1 hypothetical protein SAMN02745194_02283 [Roseomonas rosea]
MTQAVDPIWAVAVASPAARAPIRVPYGMTGALPGSTFRMPALGSSEPPVNYFSDRGWTGEPDDPDAPNVDWPARLLEPPAIEMAVPIYPTEARRFETNAGEVILANGDGALDNLTTDWRLAGRTCEVLRGPYQKGRRAPRASIVTVARFRIARLAAGSSRLRLPLGSAVGELSMPVCGTYAGTGGPEGTAAMAGQEKPWRAGLHRNVAPVQIHPGLLAYQLHDGRIHEIMSVRARGAAVAPAGDFPTWAALAAAVVAGGTYATCLALGILRIGTPTTSLTVDFRGAAPAGTGYIGIPAVIAQHLLRTQGGITADRVDVADFVAWPWKEVRLDGAGLSVAGALDKLAAGVGGWWGADLAGRFRGGKLARPEATAPVLAIQPWMLSAPPDEIPESAQPPWYRVRVAYQLLGVTQAGENLVGTVSEEMRAFWGQGYQVATSYSVETQAYGAAVDGPLVESAFDTFDDAEDYADELLRLHAAPRRGWRIGIRSDQAWRFWDAVRPGAVVSLIWPHVRALRDGRPMVVRRFSARGDRMALELWG